MTPTKVTRVYSKRQSTLTFLGGGIKQVASIPINQLDQAFPDLFPMAPSQTEVSSYNLVSWVYRCVNLRSDTIAGLPRAFFRGPNFDERLEDSEVPPEWTSVDFDWLLWRTEAARCIWGASYWVKGPDLMWLNPASMRIEYNRDRTEILRFRQIVGNGEWTPDELVYQPLWNPANDLAPGISPAHVALTAAGLSRALGLWPSAFFERGAIPAVVLTTERELKEDDSEAKRIKAMWKKATSGVRRYWETVVMGKGITPKIIGMPVDQLAIPELSQETREDIAACFGVPITMLQQSAANYATAREDTQGYYKGTAFPEAKRIQSAANIQVFRPAGYEMRFLFEEVEAIQQDEAEKATGISDLMEEVRNQSDSGLLTRPRAVWLVESLWDQMGLKFPEEFPDEEPEEPEPTDEDGTEESAGDMAPEMVQAQQAMQQAAQNLRKDLRRWRRKVKSRGVDSPFTSEHIPEWVGKAIRMRLLNGHEDVFAPFLAEDVTDTEDEVTRALLDVFGTFLPGAVKAIETNSVPDLSDMYQQIRGALIPTLGAAVADRVVARAVSSGTTVDYENLLIESNLWAGIRAADLANLSADTDDKRITEILGNLATGQLTAVTAKGLLQGLFGSARARALGKAEVTLAIEQADEFMSHD